MLTLNPQHVTFAGDAWDSVRLIAIDRKAERTALEWSDRSSHVVFVDVPAQRITIRIVRDLVRDELSPPRPGDEGDLRFTVSPTNSDAHPRTYTTRAVVTEVRYELATKRTQRMTSLTAISQDHEDPITIT